MTGVQEQPGEQELVERVAKALYEHDRTADYASPEYDWENIDTGYDWGDEDDPPAADYRKIAAVAVDVVAAAVTAERDEALRRAENLRHDLRQEVQATHRSIDALRVRAESAEAELRDTSISHRQLEAALIRRQIQRDEARSALAEARREALNEAAKVIEDEDDHLLSSGAHQHMRTAAGARALNFGYTAATARAVRIVRSLAASPVVGPATPENWCECECADCVSDLPSCHCPVPSAGPATPEEEQTDG